MSNEANKNTATADWSALWSHFNASRSAITLSTAMAVLQSIPVLGMALAVRSLFDTAIPSQSLMQLLLICAAILILGLIRSGLAVGTAYINLRISKEVISSIRNTLTKKIIQLPHRDRLLYSNNALHSVLVHDTQRVDVMLNAAITHLLPALISSMALFLLLIVINWQLALLLLLCAPLILLLNRHTRIIVQRSISDDHQAFLNFNQYSSFIVSARKLIVEKSAENLTLQRQARLTKTLKLRSRKMAWLIFFINNHLMNIVALSVICLTLGVGGALVLQNGMSVGEFLGFCAALALLRQQTTVFNSALPNVLAGRESLTSVQHLLAKRDSSYSFGNREISFKGKLQVDNLQYAHAEQAVISEFSLLLSPGTTTALSGANGAGKTTLIDLIIGHIKPDDGCIYADDIPYSNLDINALRQQIGFVPQQPILFAGSILENIIYPAKKASVQMVVSVARLTGVHVFIEQLPEGYHTTITENGTELSGGQRQCIAIARALFQQPQMLILDEPSNHLDPATVSQVLKNITNLPHKPTVLLITHDDFIANSVDYHFRLQDKRIVKIK